VKREPMFTHFTMFFTPLMSAQEEPLKILSPVAQLV
jgi:hypothetical protein